MRPTTPTAALIAFAIALPLLGACQTGSDLPTASRSLLPTDGTPGTYWHGDRSQAFERAYVVARSPQEWTELWSRIGEPAPVSLPDDRMAVAVFLGPRDTAGYGVAIDSVRQADGELQVGYHERVPGPAQAVAQMQTSPYAVRLLPKVNGTPKFQREK
ncbi:protease complex subunit PrcB family protein [Azospirillum sp. sgz302134]